MINILIPTGDNSKGYQQMIESLSHFFDVNIIVGLTQKQESQIEKLDNVRYVVFKDGTDKEEMLNSLSMFVLAGQIVILRRAVEAKKLEKLFESKAGITLAKTRARNKFFAFFVNLWHKLVQMFFGVKFYEGDNSIIKFSEDLSEVLLQTGNLSYNSRVNRWKGVDQVSVEVDDGKTERFPADKKQNLIYSLAAAALIVVAVAVTVLLCVFANINFVLGLLIVCVDIICVFMAIILVMMLAFNRKVGKKNVGEGEIVGGKVD